MRELIIVKIDIAGGRRKLDCCDVEIAIGPDLDRADDNGSQFEKVENA